MEERDRKRWKGKKDEIKMKRDNGRKRMKVQEIIEEMERYRKEEREIRKRKERDGKEERGK